MSEGGRDGTGWRRAAGVSLALTLLVGVLFTGRLPLHAHRGIPWVYYRGELQPVRYMRPGDHLQLLYRFALVEDMLRGRTPWFHNPYEFNRGDDAERYRPNPLYAPFSLAFALFHAFGSWALAWNLLGFLSLWLTALFTWLLVRRWAPTPSAAWAAAALTIAHPYRLENLLGGSPSGFSLLWIPLFFWGADAALRDGRRWGGAAAGIAIWGIAWTDPQSLFFVALAAPVWVVLRLAVFPAAAAPWRERWGRALRAAWAGLPFLLPAAAAALWIRGRMHGSFHMAGGRTVRELLMYSPPPSALFSLDPAQPVQVYLGFAWLALLAAGAAALWALFRRSTAGRARLALQWLVFCAAAAAMVALALGLYGPLGGIAIRAARKLIPFFRSVRAPPKIFCLMPTAMAVGAALAFRTLAAAVGRRRIAALALVWGAAMLAEYGLRAKPGVCLLDERQGAYAAVREDAGPDGRPRAIVLPLWPGDSHWTSVCLIHAIEYRIRLVNGYSPVVDRDYVREVFQRFRGLNAGADDPAMLDDLLRMGVRYVLLHEDAFPEKVSPFPVARTLDALRRHPRLRFLARDRSVWAFRILDAARPDAPAPPAAWAAEPWLPAIRFHAAHLQTPDERPVHRPADTPDATSDVFVRLTPGGDTFLLPRFSAVSAPRQRLWLRARGAGRLQCTAAVAALPEWSETAEAAVNSASWEWFALPLNGPPRYETLQALLEATAGTVDVDGGLLIGGDWSPALPADGVVFPAAAFFHAGFTDPDEGSVILEPLRVDEDRIFYGPRLPLAPGDYAAELAFDSPAAPDARLGEWRLDAPRPAAGGVAPAVAVRAGRPASLRFRHTGNRWVELGFRYSGAGEMTLRAVRIRPASGADAP